ncbi:hypothetical protein [Kitasatospora sp. NBC_01300]|uniref:hypothetical protein n=1 Tax=Kitasatospora sp. NBC_01300 TaxID=2903574 RepID=UPI002F9194DA|nr:hypothetical protein OG556_40260 [Kitasatospora sp. NBC_01300]
MRPEPVTVPQAADTVPAATDLTEVTLTLTDDVSDHVERRDLTMGQLTDLLLAFDDSEDSPDGPDEYVEVSLEYTPAEYGGRRWRETRSFTPQGASAVLEAFEAGALI